jgi:hypothetical protein
MLVQFNKQAAILDQPLKASWVPRIRQEKANLPASIQRNTADSRFRPPTKIGAMPHRHMA